MNPAIVIALVLMMTCCGHLDVRASIVDRGYSSGPHVGGHLWGGHGPKYQKISLIGGGGGGCGGLLRPTASASIASTASVSVPHLLHDHRRPVLATYSSRSGPGHYGSHHAAGNHCHGPTVVDCKNQLLGRLLAKKSTSLGCGGDCGGKGTTNCGHHGRLQFVGPTCCGSCGGCGGVHY